MHGIQEFPDGLVFPHRRMEERHRHIPQTEADTARDKMKRIAARGGVAANTSSCLHTPRTWLTTSLDLTRPNVFQPFKVLFQCL